MSKTNGKQMAGKREDGTFAPGHKLGNRFSKGVSGNPNGRPKITRLTDALRQQIAETNTDADDQTVAEQIAKTLIRLAISGDVQAIKEIANRTEGLPKQTLDLDIQATNWREEVRRHGITESEVAAEARLLLAEFDAGGGGEASN
jgi:HPt (histidine-containing phosphotransfer) domain-containing protein